MNFFAIHAAIDFGQKFSDFGCLTRNDFDNLIDCMDGIARINALRRITKQNICSTFQPRYALEDWTADILSDAWVNRTLKNDN